MSWAFNAQLQSTCKKLEPEDVSVHQQSVLSWHNTDFYQYCPNKREFVVDLGTRHLYSEQMSEVFSSTPEVKSSQVKCTRPVSITVKNLVK